MDPKNLNLKKDASIRYHFDEKSGAWQFSIVDVIAMTTKSSDPRNYWKVLKSRLKKEHNQLVTNLNQLKMKSSDGKFYLTDAGEAETILKILKLISSEYVLPFREWFDYLEQKNFPVLDTGKITPLSDKTENLSYPQKDYVLPINGYREKNLFIIQAFTAGVETDKLLILATCKEITIKGEYETKEKILVRDYHKQELPYGKFSRSIILPEEIDIDQVEVLEFHGLITIKLPIINKNRSRLLKIKSI
jgi:HSP20 family molecular chaperone IbpA